MISLCLKRSVRTLVGVSLITILSWSFSAQALTPVYYPNGLAMFGFPGSSQTVIQQLIEDSYLSLGCLSINSDGNDNQVVAISIKYPNSSVTMQSFKSDDLSKKCSIGVTLESDNTDIIQNSTSPPYYESCSNELLKKINWQYTSQGDQRFEPPDIVRLCEKFEMEKYSYSLPSDYNKKIFYEDIPLFKFCSKSIQLNYNTLDTNFEIKQSLLNDATCELFVDIENGLTSSHYKCAENFLVDRSLPAIDDSDALMNYIVEYCAEEPQKPISLLDFIVQLLIFFFGLFS